MRKSRKPPGNAPTSRQPKNSASVTVTRMNGKHGRIANTANPLNVAHQLMDDWAELEQHRGL